MLHEIWALEAMGTLSSSARRPPLIVDFTHGHVFDAVPVDLIPSRSCPIVTELQYLVVRLIVKIMAIQDLINIHLWF